MYSFSIAIIVKTRKEESKQLRRERRAYIQQYTITAVRCNAVTCEGQLSTFLWMSNISTQFPVPTQLQPFTLPPLTANFSVFKPSTYTSFITSESAVPVERYKCVVQKNVFFVCPAIVAIKAGKNKDSIV